VTYNVCDDGWGVVCGSDGLKYHGIRGKYHVRSTGKGVSFIAA